MKKKAHSVTCLPLFARSKQPIVGPKTALVFGATRGGTSVIAGAVRGFGFFMGDNLPVNNEDADFVRKPIAAMKATIQQRNESFGNWGWKYPMAAAYLDELLPGIRNPVLIVVCRDIAAVASWQKGNLRKRVSAGLEYALLQNQKNLLLSLRWRLPSLFVSYERATGDASSFVSELGEFLGCSLAVDEARLLAYMERGGYKSFDEIVSGETASAPSDAEGSDGSDSSSEFSGNFES